MVDLHGSQCGFCTPGFVMSLYALWMRKPQASEAEIEEALQGNLCRCTGYQPIIAAAKAAGSASPADDPLLAERDRVLARLAALDDGARVDIRTGDDRVVLPASVDDLADGPRRDPEGDHRRRLDRRRPLDHQVHARHLARGLRRAPRRSCRASTSAPTASRIGAGVSYDSFQAVARRRVPAPLRLLAPDRRLAGARHGHRRRQHRQRLADRRHARRR